MVIRILLLNVLIQLNDIGTDMGGLAFQPLPIEDPPQCVDGLVVQHQASGGAVWSSETAVGASHTFLLGQEPLTVTVMARNSVGNSSNNSILTLSKNPKRE